MGQMPKIEPILHDSVILDSKDRKVIIIPDVIEEWPTYLWKDVRNEK